MKSEDLKKYDQAREKDVEVGSRVWDAEFGASATVLRLDTQDGVQFALVQYDDKINTWIPVRDLIVLPKE